MWKKLARICPSTKKRLERFELREKERKQQNRKERNKIILLKVNVERNNNFEVRLIECDITRFAHK